MIPLRKSLLLASVIIVLGSGLKPAASQSPPPQHDLPLASQACTSFCLNNTGHAVFGTNFDNRDYDGLLFVNKRNVAKMGLEAGPHGERARWTSQYGSLTFNLAGYQFAWAGMNEAGLIVSTMALITTHNPLPDHRPPLMSPVWMQYILDTCATIDDVLATDDDVRIMQASITSWCATRPPPAP
jgi:choloylglycine hydrolase